MIVSTLPACLYYRRIVIACFCVGFLTAPSSTRNTTAKKNDQIYLIVFIFATLTA